MSVPEPSELTSVSVAPMRAARSRSPCKPKWPFDSHAVVSDTHRQVLRITESNLQPATAGVGAGIADGLIANPVDFIADNRMHFLCVTDHL